MDIEARAQLEEIVQTSHSVVERISAADLTRPTPSDGQDVASLLTHLVGWQRVFSACLRDEAPDLVDGSPAVALGPDPAAEWRAASAALLEHLHRRTGDRVELLYRGSTPVEVLVRELTAEILLHTWDLAVVIGAPMAPSDAAIAAAEDGLSLLQGEVFGPQAFHPASAFPGDDPFSRLLARSGRAPLPGPHADWRAWATLGSRLETLDGVHRPSTFSAFLASALGDTADRTVVDAGCGAGLITIAALQAGARHVIAQDFDRQALHNTASTVQQLLGNGGLRRLSLWKADFAQLDVLSADVLAVNPPQRPERLLEQVRADQRHLHVGGGADGLDTLRLVLRTAGVREIRSTAADVLDLPDALGPDDHHHWSAPRVVRRDVLPMDPAWRRIVPEATAGVTIWAFDAQR